MWTIKRANGCEQRPILPLYSVMCLYVYAIARLYEAGIALALKPTRKKTIATHMYIKCAWAWVTCGTGDGAFKETSKSQVSRSQFCTTSVKMDSYVQSL